MLQRSQRRSHGDTRQITRRLRAATFPRLPSRRTVAAARAAWFRPWGCEIEPRRAAGTLDRSSSSISPFLFRNGVNFRKRVSPL
uniref:Putative ovule protein n=1 Tax=Solanum chacoense TaxID=4108 RepID=A0A0V0GX56_SOLCH